MATSILVPFAGPGEGIEDLSWGQGSMWNTILREGQSVTMGGISPLPAGTTTQLIADLLQFAMNRHQALRTRLHFAPDGRVRQRVFSSGEIALAVVEAGEEDPVVVAERVADEYKSRPFDYEDEWPVRMAVVCQDGQATHTVAVYLHVQIDAVGLQVLVDDLANMDPETKRELAPADGIGPLEQARLQRQAAARRQSVASLRHLERALRSVPIDRFRGQVADVPAAYPMLTFSSRALHLAVGAIARQCEIDTSPVLLGLMATAVARRYQTNPFLAVLAVSNRFRPGFATSVSKLAGVSPCLIDTADATLAEVFRRARGAALTAYKTAYYDPTARRELIAQVAADRGAPVDMSCFFNDRRVNREPADTGDVRADQLRAARAGTVWDIRPEAQEVPEKLYLSVDDEADAIVYRMTFDVRYLTEADAVALAESMEGLAIDAALDPTTLAVARVSSVDTTAMASA